MNEPWTASRHGIRSSGPTIPQDTNTAAAVGNRGDKQGTSSAIATRRGESAWTRVKMNPTYTCHGRQKADLSNCVRADRGSYIPEDWPPKSPAIIAPVDVERFAALLRRAIGAVGHHPATFHA